MTVIGLHQNEWHNDHLDYIRAKRPAADLILNPSENEAAAVKGASPNTAVITRIMEWQNDAHIHNQYLRDDPAAAGREWANIVLARKHRMGKYAVLVNEPPCDLASLAKLATAEEAFMRALDASGTGIKAGVGTFSGGNIQHPAIDGGASIRAYEPSLRYAAANGHALFIHLYFVRPALGGATPSGLVYNPNDLALRWTNSILPWMRANGIPIPDIHVTEYGLDLGFAKSLYGHRLDENMPGYKAPAPWGYGTTEEGARQYAADLIAVAKAIVTGVPEIKSLLLYCAGDNGTHKWRSFMVDGDLLRHLTALELPTGGTSTQPPTNPQQPPATPPSTPTPPSAPVPPDDIRLPAWCSVTRASVPVGTRYWHLAKAWWQDHDESGGTHHLYSVQPHDPAVRLRVSNQAGTVWHVAHDKPANEPAANFAMWKGNTYTVQIEGQSDSVSGLTMPQNQHVNYLFEWELRTKGGTMPPNPAPTFAAELLALAEQRLVLEFNPTAGLQKVIARDDFNINSPEFWHTHGGKVYVAQRAEHLVSGKVRVYYAESGKWDNVKYLERGAA